MLIDATDITGFFKLIYASDKTGDIFMLIDDTDI